MASMKKIYAYKSSPHYRIISSAVVISNEVVKLEIYSFIQQKPHLQPSGWLEIWQQEKAFSVQKTLDKVLKGRHTFGWPT